LAATLRDWLKSRHEVTEALARVLPQLAAPRIEDWACGSGSFELLKSKADWTRVRFGEVVENVNETESTPAEAGLERFIGLEHLEPGSLHTRTWGNVAAGTTFTRRCRPGQVLFGKRRAYQRKVAVAEFDAVVSGDIYVFAPKDKRLIPELLPFLCLTERFFQHAVGTSAGSLSPRTSWNSLASFEFDLPLLDQQRRMVETLWAVDEVVMKTTAASDDSGRVVDAELTRFLYQSSDWQIAECRDLLAEGPRNGFSPPASATSGRTPTLSISAIRGGRVVPHGSLKYADVGADEVSQFRLQRDDILVVRGNGNRLLCGRAGIVEDFPEGCFYPDLLIRLRFRADCLLPEFAVMQWNELRTHTRLLKKAKSSNGISKINGQDIQSHQLVVPPIAEQRRFLEDLKPKTAVTARLYNSANDALDLQRSLINTLFS
jgi:type I restriction enzyme S subunit